MAGMNLKPTSPAEQRPRSGLSEHDQQAIGAWQSLFRGITNALGGVMPQQGLAQPKNPSNAEFAEDFRQDERRRKAEDAPGFVGAPNPNNITPYEVGELAPMAPPGGWSEKYDPARVGPPGGNEITPWEVAQFAPPAQPVTAAPTPKKGGGQGMGKWGKPVAASGQVPMPQGPQGENAADELAALRDGIARLEQGGKGWQSWNLKPLMALTDAWTGSNMASSYKAPMNDEERALLVQDLKMKLGGLQTQRADRRDELNFRQQQHKEQVKRWDEDRELRKALGLQKAGAAAAKGAAGAGKADLRLKNSYMTNKATRPALVDIAKSRGGSELDVPSLNDEVWQDGQYLEQQGAAQPGMGYAMALEWHRKNAMGPDGRKGQPKNE